MAFEDRSLEERKKNAWLPNSPRKILYSIVALIVLSSFGLSPHAASYSGTVNVPTNAFIYTVQPGDTLYSIGIYYGVPWQNIAAANGIPAPHIIYPGETLIVPGVGGTSPCYRNQSLPNPFQGRVRIGKKIARALVYKSAKKVTDRLCWTISAFQQIVFFPE